MHSDHSSSGDTTRIESCLAKFKNDSDAAFNELAELVYERYRLLAARILNEDFSVLHGQTDDAYQEALLKLRTALRNENVTPRTKKDLYGLVRLQIKRALLNLVKPYRRDEHHFRLDAARESEQGQIDLAVNKSDPVTSALWVEFLDCLKQLGPELREIVELRVLGGLTHQEIADILGIPKTTVEHRWKTAQVKLTLLGRDIPSK